MMISNDDKKDIDTQKSQNEVLNGSEFPLTKDDIDALKKLSKEIQHQRNPPPKTNEQDNRLEITKLFFKWFFSLICFTFIFCFAYNAWFAPYDSVEKLQVITIVSTVTTTLGTALGFIIGYYFKEK